MVKSTAKSANAKPAKKPEKPRPDFPLFAHGNGQWAKKIKGRMHYFGGWADTAAALDKYLREKDDLHAGRKPRVKDGELRLHQLCNRFLASKFSLIGSGEITSRTWHDYRQMAERVAAALGRERSVADLAADDFEHYRTSIAKRWGPVAVGNEIQRVRSLFKYGYESGMIQQPMRFGPGFKRPSKKVLRKARAEKGIRMFEAEEIRRLLGLSPWIAAAGRPLSAMILLGINCGFGNADCATLPLSAVNLATRWLEYPRPKTGIARRCKLWPETVEALKAYLAKRPAPKNEADAGLLFITKRGLAWDKSETAAHGDPDQRGGNHASPISFEMKKALKKLDLYRPGLGFYALRHTFRTVADESRDQPAVNHVMGHCPDDMASLYRERIGDDRLEAVANHVREWLFGVTKPTTSPAPAPAPTQASPVEPAPDGDTEDEEPRILKMQVAK